MTTEEIGPIVIIDRNQELHPGGQTLLRFTLSEAPSDQWRGLFSSASPLTSGSFDFVHSQPEFKGEVISWTVAQEEAGTATVHVEQSIAHANQEMRAHTVPGGDEAAQARARKHADDAGVAARKAAELHQAELRKAADSAGAAERQANQS